MFRTNIQSLLIISFALSLSINVILLKLEMPH